jgi:hypothetical protein
MRAVPGTVAVARAVGNSNSARHGGRRIQQSVLDLQFQVGITRIAAHLFPVSVVVAALKTANFRRIRQRKFSSETFFVPQLVPVTNQISEGGEFGNFLTPYRSTTWGVILVNHKRRYLRRRSLLDEGDDVTFDVDTLICGAFLAHWRVGAL